jgi:hypothetical protein
MASTRTVNEPEKPSSKVALPEQEVDIHSAFPRIGLLNGLLIGLALALGVWGLEAINLLGVPIPLQYPSLIVGSILLVALCALAGWISGRFEQNAIVLLIWLVAGILTTLVVAFQPTIGRTLTIWLADFRFWGLPIYPSLIESLTAPIIAGFFIFLVLGLLAILQNYRLEMIAVEVNEAGRLMRRGWFLLLLPLPLVIIAGAVTAALFNDPSGQALQAVHRAIPVVVNSEGDLFAQGLEDGLNYSAFNSVRDQLTENYTLRLGEIDPVTSTTYVIANFDRGAWVACRILNDQLSFCYDTVAPYTIGLASLITGEALPDPCPGCLPRVDQTWQSWLAERGANFAREPQIDRVAQWGGYVLMRVESGDYALECWFSSFSPVQLDRCVEVAPEG